MYMEFLTVTNGKLKVKKTFTHGSSALLHVDWSQDSSIISLNTQAYELLFYTTEGTMVSASATADEKWASWTRKLGFQVKGIFQGIDFSEVHTVCREPNNQFIAVGYNDQTVRLFRYPCYIEKQVSKTFYGHSSHLTRVKFTSEKMVTLGGNDRTVIVWDVERPYQQK
jgi:microtubule-associated protein-like 6